MDSRTFPETKETIVAPHWGRESPERGEGGSEGEQRSSVAETQTGLHQCDLDIPVKEPLNRLAGMVHDWIGTQFYMAQ